MLGRQEEIQPLGQLGQYLGFPSTSLLLHFFNDNELSFYRTILTGLQPIFCLTHPRPYHKKWSQRAGLNSDLFSTTLIVCRRKCNNMVTFLDTISRLNRVSNTYSPKNSLETRLKN